MVKSKADTTKDIPKLIPLDKELILTEFLNDNECQLLDKELSAIDTAEKQYEKRVFKWVTATNPSGEQTALHRVKLSANAYKLQDNQKRMNKLKQAFVRAYDKAIASDDKRYKMFVEENRKTIHNNTAKNQESIKFAKPKPKQGGINKVVIDVSKDSDGNFKTSEKFARENSPKQLLEMWKDLEDYFSEVREIQIQTKQKIDAKNKLQEAA
jgi:hypothetical protein